MYAYRLTTALPRSQKKGAPSLRNKPEDERTEKHTAGAAANARKQETADKPGDPSAVLVLLVADDDHAGRWRFDGRRVTTHPGMTRRGCCFLGLWETALIN